MGREVRTNILCRPPSARQRNAITIDDGVILQFSTKSGSAHGFDSVCVINFLVYLVFKLNYIFVIRLYDSLSSNEIVCHMTGFFFLY